MKKNIAACNMTSVDFISLHIHGYNLQQLSADLNSSTVFKYFDKYFKMFCRISNVNLWKFYGTW